MIRLMFLLVSFQLTHSRGVRQERGARPAATAIFQLTHSRGVRPVKTKCNENTQNFNSRTHVECDQQKNLQLTISLIFQLTHSRGVRPYAVLRRFQRI